MKQYSLELYHHGVKDMRWGVRRYQNKDGTLTPAGKARAKRYRENEIAKLDRKYRRLAKVDAKLEKKISDQLIDPTERRAKKIDKLAFESYRLAGMKMAEDAKLRSMSAKELLSEKHKVNVQRGVVVVGNVALNAAMNLLTPVKGAIISVPSEGEYQTNLRVDSKTQKAVAENARIGAKTHISSILDTSQPKKTFDESTRVTGKKESDFWKAYAQEEERKRKRNS